MVCFRLPHGYPMKTETYHQATSFPAFFAYFTAMKRALQMIMFLSVVALSCHSAQQDATQGIRGKVTWFEGDLMPGPGRDIPTGKPIERTILIYPLTNLSQVKGSAPLFESVAHEPLQRIRSNAEGTFTANLAPGFYSILIKEDEGLFANFFDGNDNIHPVEVKQGTFTQVEIEVNYKAAY